MNTIPPIPGGVPLAAEVDRLRRECVYDSLVTDELATALELRVSALEEALISRRARRRLRRALRESDATYAWAGPTFADRRAEAAGAERLASPHMSTRFLPRPPR